MGFTSVAPIAHQSGFLKEGEVLGDHGLRDAGMIGKGVNGVLTIARQALEERSAGRIGESLEQ